MWLWSDEWENVQKRAARFVTRNYSYETGSMTGILEELKWETLQKRRKDNRLILLYKGLKGKARIPTDMTLSQRTRVGKMPALRVKSMPLAFTGIFRNDPEYSGIPWHFRKNNS